MSVGGSLISFPRWVILLFHCDALGVGPIHVAPKPVAPCGVALVLRLLVDAGCTVVLVSHWVKTMQAAVTPMFRSFFIWGCLLSRLLPLLSPLLVFMFLQLSLVAMLAMVVVRFFIFASIVVNLFVV